MLKYYKLKIKNMESNNEKKIFEEKSNFFSISSREEIFIDKSPFSSKPKTKLSHKYSFWFKIFKNNQMKKIAEFDTIEDFWAIYQHLKKPDNFNKRMELKMLKEDELNKNEGILSFLCNKGYTSIIWEEILLGLLSGIIPKNISDNINSIVCISKNKYNLIQILFKEYNQDYYKDLEKCIRNLTQMPHEVPIIIKKFFDNNNKVNK